ncbi:hypothetical protein K523DRAFT_190728, partial [Schizophyllum commune Tattone D]
ETALQQYSRFLDTLEAPHFDNPQKKRRFLQRAMEFFRKDEAMYRRQRKGPPQRVIMDPTRRQDVIRRAHD